MHALSSVQGIRDRLFTRLFILNGLETGTIVFGTRQWLPDGLYQHRTNACPLNLYPWRTALNARRRKRPLE